MANNDSPNKNSTEMLVEELDRAVLGQTRFGRGIRSIAIPILAVFTGLVVSGIFIALTSEEMYAAFGESIGAGFSEAWRIVWSAYKALFEGAFGSPTRIAAAFTSGDAEEIRRAINPFLESLMTSTPLIFAGLSVALAFKGGLFNIGAEGQLFIGAALATYVGFAFTGLPEIIHLPLAILAGFVGGAIWGYIPGWLKAKTGGHEVINTIMMNYIAFRLVDWLLRGTLQDPESTNPISPLIAASAEIPRFGESPIRLHWGFILSLVMAWLVWWFLFKTKWGFTLRTVGANQNAARYAGMNIVMATIASMALSGGLAGLAGANEILGVNHRLQTGFATGLGFDAIALALLGNNHPLGVVLAALLFGAMRSGATRMQVAAGIPIDIIAVVQALVLAFIAAPAIVRTIYRLREQEGEDDQLVTSSWG